MRGQEDEPQKKKTGRKMLPRLGRAESFMDALPDFTESTVMGLQPDLPSNSEDEEEVPHPAKPKGVTTWHPR